MTFLADPRPRMPALRRAPAWLAAWIGIFALYLQLAAAAAFLSGATKPDVQSAEASIFPICHGQASGDGLPGAPEPTPCPLCAFHAHAATALPPPAGLIILPSALRVSSPAPPRITARREGRVLIASAPRGPPVA